ECATPGRHGRSGSPGPVRLSRVRRSLPRRVRQLLHDVPDRFGFLHGRRTLPQLLAEAGGRLRLRIPRETACVSGDAIEMYPRASVGADQRDAAAAGRERYPRAVRRPGGIERISATGEPAEVAPVL